MPDLRDVGKKSIEACGIDKLSFGQVRDADRKVMKVTRGNSQWEGWGTALKPAHEPICMARKPLAEDTIAENVLKYGTGGINIDESRVGTEEISVHDAPKGTFAGGEPDRGSDTESYRNHQGRFPANLIHDGSNEVVDLFPNTKSGEMNSIAKEGQYNTYGKMYERRVMNQASEGSAARFFYCAKASKSERDEGCEELSAEHKSYTKNRKCKKCGYQEVSGSPCKCAEPEWEVIERESVARNHHPTVKPLSLMKYLIKLVTQPNGIVLDPFMGSGTTGVACKEEGFGFIGIEREKEYMEIAQKRMDAPGFEEDEVEFVVKKKPTQTRLF
jgi:site-specific DNA-methyltransferase (adenine-specific)